MKILCMCSYFPPEFGGAPKLSLDLTESLANAGHDVTVVTVFPRYYVPVMPKAYRGKLFCRERINGLKVLRINAPNFHGRTRIGHGLIHLLVPPVLALRALPLESPDVVCTALPPLAMGVAARVVARRFGVPYVVKPHDLFPQTAIDMGMLRNRILIRFFQAMERSVYRNATAIAPISDGHADYVVARGADRARVHTVPDWVDTHHVRPGERMNAFRQAHGLADKFVVLYAGTMGWHQGLEVAIEAARLLADEPELVFLMVGDGLERKKLKRLSDGLSNVRFLPMQPQEVYPEVLAACDAGLVPLRQGITAPTVPGKACTTMAAGRPVLACLPDGVAGDDARRQLADSQGGLALPAGDAGALASAILKLKQDPQAGRRMGQRGRAYIEANLSKSACVRKFEAVLEQAVDARLAGRSMPRGEPHKVL